MSLQDDIARWLKDYAAAAGADGYVIGLSGGVDSATAAALAVRAVGAHAVLAVLLPCHSQAQDGCLALEVAKTFGIPTLSVDLDGAFDALMGSLPETEHPLATANVKPRLRMVSLYYLAQMHNYLVLGSGNKTELMVGYFTKYGDGGVDVLPLGDLTKTEVLDLARALGVPTEVVERPPSAGLWPGQTDEGELGITYRELDQVLMAIQAGETDDVAPAKLAKVQRLIASSEHKRAMPPIFKRC